ncbi:hypothetical protein EON67_12535 [archaeon]|nr:MAG: hypothetical protein EON67_12535 [archaeon]
MCRLVRTPKLWLRAARALRASSSRVRRAPRSCLSQNVTCAGGTTSCVPPAHRAYMYPRTFGCLCPHLRERHVPAQHTNTESRTRTAGRGNRFVRPVQVLYSPGVRCAPPPAAVLCTCLDRTSRTGVDQLADACVCVPRA